MKLLIQAIHKWTLTLCQVQRLRGEMAAMSNSEQALYGIQRFVGIFLGSAGMDMYLFLIRYH